MGLDEFTTSAAHRLTAILSAVRGGRNIRKNGVESRARLEPAGELRGALPMIALRAQRTRSEVLRPRGTARKA